VLNIRMSCMVLQLPPGLHRHQRALCDKGLPFMVMINHVNFGSSRHGASLSNSSYRCGNRANEADGTFASQSMCDVKQVPNATDILEEKFSSVKYTLTHY
jgi:hypothetical protein